MYKNHGTFTPFVDNRRNGSTYQNEDGLDWQRFVLRRVMFNDFGQVIELYDDKDKLIEGDHFFAAVRDGVVVGASNRDPSALAPFFPAEVVETDIPVDVGWVFTGRGFKAPPEPPLTVYKSEMIAAMTDEQHGTWAEGFAKATPKQRNIWDNTMSFQQGSDEYATAQALAVSIFGPYGYNFFPK